MMKWIRDWGEAFFVAVILTLIIRTFVVQAFKIPSGSMEDTLLIGDYLLVNKFIYGTHLPFMKTRYLKIRNPERGDVIVFEFPGPDDHRDFIKRVIGVPGDTIAVENKQLYINGEPVTMPQAVHKDSMIAPPAAGPRDFFGPVTVPEGHVFVMGDNRDYSYDSRFWGFVPEENIHGLAFIKYWSWDSQAFRPRLGRIGHPIH